MPQCCSVPLCSERKGGHKFPSDKFLLKKWLIAIRRDKFKPTVHSRVCKKHFTPECYTRPKESIKEKPTPILKKDAVPTKFSWNDGDTLGIDARNKKRSQRALNRELKKIEKEKLLLESVVKENNVSYPKSNERELCCASDYAGDEVEVETVNIDVGIQCCLCECKNDSIPMPQITLSLSHSANDDSNGKRFRIENFKDKADEVKFYTGFSDYDHFIFVFNLFGEEVNNLLYYPSMNVSRRERVLNPSNEFFLTLVKLRRNMCNKELSFNFQISQTSVSNIFITWINFLYCKFKELDLWSSKNVLDRNLKLRGKSNPCTIIIDCTEIKIEKPKNPISQQATYSTYKSANTLKVLVGISASGCITFASDAYGGSISDRELFQKSGLINLLQPGDIILGDRGFNIQDLLCHKDITINTPEFLKGSGQFEAHQLKISKKVSSNRIHIERVIGLGKTFKILSGKLVSSLVPLGDRIIFECFMLTNFRSNIMFV